jgi:hypothetical protein
MQKQISESFPLGILSENILRVMINAVASTEQGSLNGCDIGTKIASRSGLKS